MSGDDSVEGRVRSALDLQQQFFTPPNRFAFTTEPHASDDNVIRALAIGLLRHQQGYPDQPVLLPYCAEGKSTITWFACAPAGARARALQAELNAFLGPSFATFAPIDRSPDTADQHLHPLLLTANWTAFRFVAGPSTTDTEVLKEWSRYTTLLERRPRTTAYIPQRFNQLRAAFDRALAARDESAARALMGALIGALREQGLSAENRLFLDFRLAAALGRWRDILDHPLLPRALLLNLPRETYGDVVEALYHDLVEPAQEHSALEPLLTAFAELRKKGVESLFRTRGTSERPEVRKSFLLYELCQPAPDGYVAAKHLALLPPEAFGAVDAAVRARVAALQVHRSEGEARKAVELQEFDRAFDLFWPLPDTQSVLEGLAGAACLAEDPVKAKSVLARLAATPPTLQAVVRQTLLQGIPHLEKLAQSQPSIGTSWRDRLERAEGETTGAYVERWRELARATDVVALLAEDGIGEIVMQYMLGQATQDDAPIELLYPLWFELFVDRCPPSRHLRSVYEFLLEVPRNQGTLAGPELALMHQTLLVLLPLGLSPSSYRRVVGEFRAVFDKVRAPQTLTWGLAVCDSLAVAPAGDSEARLRLLSSVVQACVDFRPRLTDLQKVLVRLLAEEAGMQPPVALPSPDAAEVNDAGERTGLLALYSLDEPAARRAAGMLAELFPRLRIECCADLVATPRLRQLARAADVFVFAWKSSKHAAYDCVKAAIPDKDTLVMAPGGGATSLLITAEQHLRRTVAVAA